MKGKDGATDGILGTHCKVFEDFVKELLTDQECPPCALAILRQAKAIGVDSFVPYYDFKEEMSKYFEVKNKEAQEEEYRSLLSDTY